MASQVIRVEGMSCGGCEASLQKAVSRVDGVASVEASAERGEAVVHYEEGAREPDWAAVRKAIAAAGFEARD